MEIFKGNDLRAIVIHNGVFHCDDVMCVALAFAINPDIAVIRVPRVPDNLPYGTVVADIEGGWYDHHLNHKFAEDGHMRTSCGLFLADYWDQIFPNRKAYEDFDRCFIFPIENADNGLKSNPLSTAIVQMNPVWDAPDNGSDEAFFDAVDIISTAVIEPFIERRKAEIRGRSVVRKARDESILGHIVVLPHYVPWKKILCPSQAKLVIYPSLRNESEWILQCVPVRPHSGELKIELPEQWLIKKPSGCTFCHLELFLASFDTQEHALSAARNVIVKCGVYK